MGTSWCPRCGSDLIAPSAFDSAWRCSTHGKTLPLNEFRRLEESTIAHIRNQAEVPLWLPDPMPLGWQLSGLAAVGDTRSRYRATVSAFRGPAPLGGLGEWLIVAEEPGIGLGASYAGSDGSTPQEAGGGPAVAKLLVRGHLSSIWPVLETASDRSAYVGEAAGVWLWLIGLPADAGYAVLENLSISDLRHRHVRIAPPGERSHRLRPGAVDREAAGTSGDPAGGADRDTESAASSNPLLNPPGSVAPGPATGPTHAADAHGQLPPEGTADTPRLGDGQPVEEGASGENGAPEDDSPEEGQQG